MFGRFNEIEDQPGWREKLAELRDSPPWMLQRPKWLRESPTALLLLFVGIALVMTSVVYVVVPAEALPASVPGRWVAPVTTSTSSTTSTTTTTVPTKVKEATFKKIEAMSAAKRERFWAYVNVHLQFVAAQAKDDLIVSGPPQSPGRRWAFAFLAAVGAVGFLIGAWLLSDTRARIRFQK